MKKFFIVAMLPMAVMLEGCSVGNVGLFPLPHNLGTTTGAYMSGNSDYNVGYSAEVYVDTLLYVAVQDGEKNENAIAKAIRGPGCSSPRHLGGMLSYLLFTGAHVPLMLPLNSISSLSSLIDVFISFATRSPATIVRLLPALPSLILPIRLPSIVNVPSIFIFTLSVPIIELILPILVLFMLSRDFS